MDIATLKEKTDKELHDLLGATREKLREYRHKDAERQLKDTRAIRKVKKAIAQILTMLNNRRKEKEAKQA